MDTSTKSLAAGYAASIAEGIRANVANGYPFGVCDEDHYADDKEEGEELSAYDYLSDVLDIEYLVNARGEYRSARILITCGGPNAVIDTRTRYLEVTWDGFVTERLPGAFIDALDDACADFWESAR